LTTDQNNFPDLSNEVPLTSADQVTLNQRRQEAYELWLGRLKKQALFKDLTPDEITAIARTLAACPKDIAKAFTSMKKFKNKHSIYSTAMVNAKVSFPCATLEHAVKYFKQLDEGRLQSGSDKSDSNWGYNSLTKTYTIPEVVDENYFWDVISALLEKEGLAVARVKDPTQNFEIPNGEAFSSQEIQAYINRLVSLSKSPLTATFRSLKTDIESVCANRVDYVMLDLIKTGYSHWDRLTFKPEFEKIGKRYYQNSREIRKGNQISQVPINGFKGYALAERLVILGRDVTFAKDFESHPIFQIVYNYLKHLVERSMTFVSEVRYELPKTALNAPSESIKSSLRHGPSQARGKNVSYVPFSYVKSKECEAMPIALKKTCTELSSKLMRRVEHINVLAPSSANKQIDAYREYLSISYNVSDEIRRQWRSTASIPDATRLKEVFGKTEEILSQKYLAELSALSQELKFKPVEEDPQKMSVIRQKLSEIAKARESGRSAPKASATKSKSRK
jgi:hypothetical protein